MTSIRPRSALGIGWRDAIGDWTRANLGRHRALSVVVFAPLENDPTITGKTVHRRLSDDWVPVLLHDLLHTPG
jgi:hypothetical protein